MKIWFDKNTWRAVYMFGLAGVGVWITIANIIDGNECMRRVFKIDED